MIDQPHFPLLWSRKFGNGEKKLSKVIFAIFGLSQFWCREQFQRIEFFPQVWKFRLSFRRKKSSLSSRRTKNLIKVRLFFNSFVLDYLVDQFTDTKFKVDISPIKNFTAIKRLSLVILMEKMKLVETLDHQFDNRNKSIIIIFWKLRIIRKLKLRSIRRNFQPRLPLHFWRFWWKNWGLLIWG